MEVLREQAWKSLGICHQRIHIDVDTADGGDGVGINPEGEAAP